MTTIIGVDFSGAKEDRDTWVTCGRLDDAGSLTLDYSHPIRREDLYRLLAGIPPPAVVAVDFPFGVPKAFAKHIRVDAQTAKMTASQTTEISAVWQKIHSMGKTKFLKVAKEFTINIGNKRPKRTGDVHCPRNISPLHWSGPDMVTMTYEGVRLLRRWYAKDNERWYVPPLAKPVNPDATVTLLELMPGGFLERVGLRGTGYKDGKTAEECNKHATQRMYILDNLAQRCCIGLNIPDSVRLACYANHDCLDSVIAAVGAAMWAQDCSRFRAPTDAERADARLEGWIYVPKPQPRRGE